MIQNYPYLHKPKSWDEVCFQPQIVKVMQSWLKANTFPNFIFMQGGSGTGKTCTASLLIQTTHCHNRSLNATENCGHCLACTSDPQLSSAHSNVIWVNAGAGKGVDGEDITYQQAIRDALSASDQGPVQTGYLHRDILFVVFEEAHLMPSDLFQRCLAKADSQSPFTGDVVYIFLTMSPQEIKDTARQAISQRGAILDFQAPTTAELKDYLKSKFSDLNNSTAQLIAEAAGNSVRGALSAYKTCLDFQEPITELSAAQVLRFLSSAERMALWNLIKSKSKAQPFTDLAESLLRKTSGENLAKLLLRDLDAEYELLGETTWFTASMILTEFLRNPKTLNLSYALLSLRGLNWPNQFQFSDPNISTSANLYAAALNKTWPSIYN